MGTVASPPASGTTIACTSTGTSTRLSLGSPRSHVPIVLTSTSSLVRAAQRELADASSIASSLYFGVIARSRLGPDEGGGELLVAHGRDERARDRHALRVAPHLPVREADQL